MRYTFLIFLFATILFCSCDKDKFTSEPQIEYKDIKPNFYKRGTPITGIDNILTIKVTDAEGDLGIIAGKDTARFYIKNLRTNKIDSADFPDIRSIASKKFSADIRDSIRYNAAVFFDVPNFSVKDTIYYEVYIKDFAKNKSNVIRCGPLYYLP